MRPLLLALTLCLPLSAQDRPTWEAAHPVSAHPAVRLAFATCEGEAAHLRAEVARLGTEARSLRRALATAEERRTARARFAAADSTR